MELEFIVQTTEYSVAELYEKFHADLPVIVKVNQGFQGHSADSTFGKGEILFIAAVSKQKRVVAKVQSGGGRERVISIPAEFPENLCVVKRGKCGPEHSLTEILHDNRLPVEVQFPPNDIIIMEGKRIFSRQIPAMKLLKKYEETYLLGNLYAEGNLDKKVLYLPVYLSQLRLNEVTGLKYLKADGWEQHVQQLIKETQNLQYNLLFGNQDVAEFNREDLHHDTNFAYVEPCRYDTILNLMKHWPECRFLRSSGDLEEPGSKEEAVLQTQRDTVH